MVAAVLPGGWKQKAKYAPYVPLFKKGAGSKILCVCVTERTSLCLLWLQIFEWWYFRKYGTSFIEQVSVSHLRPLLGGVDSSSPTNSNTSNGDADSSRQSVSGKRRAGAGPVGGRGQSGSFCRSQTRSADARTPLAHMRGDKQL